MPLRGSLTRRVQRARAARRKTSLPREVAKITEKKAYLKQIEKEAAEKGRRRARKEYEKSKSHWLPSRKGTERVLAGGARFSERFIGDAHIGAPPKARRKGRKTLYQKEYEKALKKESRKAIRKRARAAAKAGKKKRAQKPRVQPAYNPLAWME